MTPQIETELIETTLRLQAEIRALKTIVGFLLVDTPSSLEKVKSLLPRVDDLTLPTPLSDMQRDHLRQELEEVVRLVEANRDQINKTA